MATRNEDLKYRLLGEDVSAGRTFSKVATDAKAAHGAISELGQTLNSTGAFQPFTQGLDAISMGFQHIQENGKSARVVMQGVGIGIAAAGAALLGLGANAQQATAGLKAAIESAGGVYGEYSKSIEETVAKTATFGRTAGDTENALARLVTATQDPQKALSLMGLTANIAAARNMNLTDSAQLLTTALAGNTRVFRQFGINVGTGKLSADQLNQALDQLNQRLSGRAQAQADTFSGRIKGLAVEFENGFESLTKFSPLLLTVGASMTIASAGWDLLAKAKERNVVADAANVASSGRVAAAEGGAAAAAAASAGLMDLRTPGAVASVEASGIGAAGLLARGNLLRAGGFGVGGLVAGQLAGVAFGHGAAGSSISDALSGAGLGAGVGSIVPGVGTLLGAGIGAAGGALLGLFHHGSGQRGKLEDFQKQLVAQQDAATTSAFAQYLASELDPLGNPKAAKVASANEALAKAKTRLARAQEDLNKQQSKGQDPLALEAATSRLASAEANLRKAQYLGGDARVASAQSAVASAQQHLNALHAGPDTTAAARRVTDARAEVTAGQRDLKAAREDAAGLSAAQVLGRLRGNARSNRQRAADEARLTDVFHLSQPVLAAIDAADKADPGTLRRVSRTITPAIAEALNRAEASFQTAAKMYAAAGKRAFQGPAEALGTQMAEWQFKSFDAKMRNLLFGENRTYKTPAAMAGIPPQYAALYDSYAQRNAAPAGPSAQALAAAKAAGVPPQYAGAFANYYIANQTVQATDPRQFAQEMNDQARHRALSGPRVPVA